MIELNNESFIYTLPILVQDPKHIVKLKVNLNDKQKDVKPDEFYIKFADEIPSNVKLTDNSLFGNVKADNDFLKKTTTKTIESPFGDKEKLKTVYYENVCLFKMTTIKHLKYILAYQMELNISNLNIYIHREGEDNLCSEDINSLGMNGRDVVFHHAFEINSSNIETYDDCVSIGNNFMIVMIEDNTDNKLNHYEDFFYKENYQLAKYIKRLLTNLEKQKISSYPLHINISQITVSLIYTGPKHSHSNINIAKLFNIHHVGTFSKIYIHSNELDEYNSNPRPIQYVKVDTSATNMFKGINSLYNTCSLYWGLEIDKGVALHHIEIQSNMTINFVFTNINTQNDYKYLSSILKKWMDENYINILKKTKIAECIYNIDYNHKFYIPYFNGINASANIDNASISDIDALNEILLQEVCKLKFRTRTSIQMNGYGFTSLGSFYKLMYLNSVHEYVTNNIVYKDMLPTLHVGMNGSTDLTISISDSFTFDELIFSFSYLLASFGKLNKPHNDTLIHNATEMNIESIRKQSSKYGKNLLKILEKMDPRLFGPRKVGKKFRSFSGLCQKPKQRSVPITLEEYEYLRSIVPDSVADLRNQTYPEQRIYLFCPNKTFSFLNYHTFPNQLCIVRCTTKPSNKTQYNYCATSLDARHVSNIQNKYENQTITLYNALITKGRKCKVPEELKNVLTSYILLKLDINNNIYKYCDAKYGKRPFIIRRNPIQSIYSILTEYNDESDYILILQSELNEDYFIFLNEEDGEPLIFSHNEEIKKFFINMVKKTNSQYNFFNFLEKILKKPLSQYYNLIIKDILSILKKEFEIKFVVHEKFVRGIIWNNKLYLTPSFYWVFEGSEMNIIPLFKAIEEVMNGKCKLPSINSFDEEHVDKLYKNYSDGKIHMIDFYNAPMLVEPFDVSAKWNAKDIIVNDYNAILMNLYNLNINKSYDMKSKQIKVLNIDDVLKNYVYIYMMTNSSLSVSDLLTQLKATYIVYDNETFIQYTDNKYKTYVSWRGSKINENDFNEFFSKFANISINDNIKSIYKKFKEELNFKVYKNEVIVPKIITS